jgi:protein kinase
MTILSKYEKLTRIYESERSRVYRATKINDGQTVILKVLKNEYPTPDQLRHYRQEHHLTHQLQLAKVIKCYGLEEWQRTLVIIYEDFGGTSLNQLLKQYPQGLPIDLFLNLAFKLSNAICQLHSQSIIHKDINPSNIVFNPESKQLKLIDLGISTQISHENPILQIPNALEGTLPYLSPEQTGRMNRVLDYRCDFYSLGVTFYELLSGRLPFQSSDPMELVYCHIAKQPESLVEISQGRIPSMLVEVVNKLMAKNAEDRYQSAWGLKSDLEECWAQWERAGAIAKFSLGRMDVPDRFQIPEKLYGRERETNLLLSSFERITSRTSESDGDSHAAELILVTGYSGIGKSSVVRSLYQPITAKRGYFISGKFERLQRNSPYFAIVKAFGGLAKQLLGEHESVLQQWRDRLVEALGSNGKVITDVIPEMELIIGSQPPVTILGASETKNRFNLVFQRFMQVFCRAEHPLVLFLDDMQWADLATLELMERLLGDCQIQHLLVIAAYRDNEVSESHPLALTINQLQIKQVNLEQITLAPLTIEQIEQLISETLHQSSFNTKDLAELVSRKTNGNPFFVNQFLKILYSDSLLSFNYSLGEWQWELEKIEKTGFTDNVVELMIGELQKLPKSVQDVLSIAAYLGTEFDLSTLSLVQNRNSHVIFDDLKIAIDKGFAIAKSSLDENILIQDYQFGHDRIQQAAYALIPEGESYKTHYQIGQLLLEHWTEARQEEQIFKLVKHLNDGIDLISNQVERDRLVHLNLLASRKAKLSTAYQSAYEYAEIGLRLLGSEAWQQQYDIKLQLCEIAAEVAALCRQFERMDLYVNEIVSNTKSVIEQVTAYIIKIQALSFQNQFTEAISHSLEILQKLGVQFPDAITPEFCSQANQKIDDLIGDRKITDLYDLPTMRDSIALAKTQIAALTIPACHILNAPIYPFLMTLQVNLSIEYGNCSSSAFSYAAYGVYRIIYGQDIDSATDFGRLAYKLASKSEAKDIRSETFFPIGLFLHHRKFPLRETLPILQDGYHIGLETGKFEHTGYCGYGYTVNAFWSGLALSELESTISAYEKQLRNLNQITNANYCEIIKATVSSLLGNPDKVESNFALITQEEELIRESLAADSRLRLFLFYLHRAFLKFLTEEMVGANIDIAQARYYMQSLAGIICKASFYFYDSLILLTSVGSEDALKSQYQRIQENQSQLKVWAKYAPMNHLHKWQLVEAETCSVLGQKERAMELYDLAIAGAKQNQYLQETALANELAANFYLNWGKATIARLYMMEARHGYLCWGAIAKVKQIDQHYSQLLQTNFSNSSSLNLSANRGLNTLNNRSNLDLETLMKASRAISSEIVLESLLQTLMRILLENAGAQMGCLLLPSSTISEDLSGNLQIAIYISGDRVNVFPTESLDCVLPESILHYVARSRESIVLDRAAYSVDFTQDPYIQSVQPMSILCYPLINQGDLVGIVYMENQYTANVFTSDRIEFLQLIRDC